jgi:hypothetical protein
VGEEPAVLYGPTSFHVEAEIAGPDVYLAVAELLGVESAFDGGNDLLGGVGAVFYIGNVRMRSMETCS